MINDNKQNTDFLQLQPQDTQKTTQQPSKNPKKVKEMIQTALNLINGIAFGSHGKRFQNEKQEKTMKLPGPADYNININSTPRKINLIEDPIQVGIIKEKIPVQENTRQPGPGAYFTEEPTLIKRSFNVTLPNNIIIKRRDDIIKERIRIEDSIS